MKLKKMILVNLILIILILFTSNVAYSADSNIIETGKSWLKISEEKAKDSEGAKDWAGFNSLAGILWGVGIFVILICGVTVGIKYMFSSLEEKADLKANLVPYVIGAVIILGALSIWKFTVEFLNTIN